MKPLLLFLLTILLSDQSWAQSSQTIQVKGRIFDRDSHEWLPGANVVCLRAKDSSIVAVRHTDQDGRFVFDSLLTRDYCLIVSFIGYSQIKYPFSTISKDHMIDLNNIALVRIGIELSQVEIVQTKNPVVIKKDTLEFNASYFRPKENDLIEELLRKIPGVEIDNDGSIRINGRAIKSLLINGSPVFGDGNQSMISRNLLANIIDKVQLIDVAKAQNQSSRNIGESEKVLNITTKKSIQDILNGQLSAAIGIGDRFGVRANLNQFRKKQQIILIGNGSNINGLLDGLTTRNDRIENRWQAGINYNNNISNKIVISASYFIDKNITSVNRTSSKQIIMSDTGYLSNQNYVGKNLSNSHKVSTLLEYKIDSLVKLTISNQVVFNYENKEFGITYQSVGTKNNLLNNGTVKNSENDRAYSLSSTISLDKKFIIEGRGLSIFGGISKRNGNGTGSNESFNNSYNTDIVPKIDTINLRSSEKNNANNFFLNIDYTEPLSKTSLLSIAYGEDHMIQPLNRSVFGFNKVTSLFDILTDSLSSNFTYGYHQRYGKLGWLNQIGKIEYGVSVAGIISNIYNIDVTSNQKARINASGIIPNIRLKYTLADRHFLQITYFRSMQLPTVDELQPVVDNRDPMYIKVGNPDLKPSWLENFDVTYSSINSSNLRSFHISLYGSLVRDEIINDTWLDSIGRQIVKPINLSGAVKLGFNFSGYIPIKPEFDFLRINTSVISNRDLNYLNGIKGHYNYLSVNQSLSYGLRYGKMFDFLVSGNVSYNIAKYPSLYLNRSDNTRYYLSFEGNINIKGGISFQSKINHEWLYSSNQSYNRKYLILNGSISKSLFSNKQGLIKFQVFDLLNQNMQITQNIGVNYVETGQTEVLHHLFLLKFSYIIGKK